jgi:hypothetical protein
MKTKSIVTAVLLITAFSAQGEDEDWKLLQQVADVRSSNLAKLDTWRGKAIVERSTGYNEASFQVDTYEEAGFAHDQVTGSTRWTLTIHDATYIHDPAPLYAGTWDNRDQPKIHGALFSDEHEYRSRPHIMKADGTTENTLVIRARHSKRPRSGFQEFHPMYYFTYHGRDLSEMIRFRYEHRKTGRPLSISRVNDLVTWDRSANNVTNVYIFDLSKGGNLVQYIGADPSVNAQHEWDYTLIDGIWVPSVYRYKNKNTKDNGKIQLFGQKVTFVKHELNTPLEEEEFTLEGIGVRPGTRVTDNVQGIAYKYGDPNTIKKIHYQPKKTAKNSE